MRFAVTALLAFAFALHAAAQISHGNFAGRWDLTIHDPQGDYPSWIEVDLDAAGAATILFVGRIGSAEPLPSATISHGTLTFSVPADTPAGAPQNYSASLHGSVLQGRLTQRGHADLAWTGARAPGLLPDPSLRWGAPQSLFDGSTLKGWHPTSPGNNHWSVVNGTLVNTGRGADLVTNATFTDLQLHVEFRCSAKANSGVYLRGRYEIQIETDSASEPPSHHTGGIYGFLAPHPEQPRQPGQWQTFDIELIGRQITVRQNGIVILNREQIPGITGGAINSDEAAPGPVILQGGEDGTVEFRNLRIRLPASSRSITANPHRPGTP